jgi:glycosyltransferase involved in cell wall biosynthesis
MSVRLPLREGVIVANVQRFSSYQVAEAAHGAGYLQKLVTSIYYKPATLAGRSMHALAVRAGDRARQRLEGRHSPLLPDDKVVAMPAAELIEEGAKVLGKRFGKDSRPVTYLKNEVFDWAVARRHIGPCTIFHGWEQCALFSFRKARSLGALTVLDQTQIHRTSLERLEREERARHGVPARDDKPFWFDQHVTRKYKEVELTDYVFSGLGTITRTMVENGFPAERIFTIPFGADVDRYQPIARPPREGFEILYIGPLNFWKGLPYLFDVMEGLDIPGARLTIVGRNDPDWRPYIDRRMAALGDRVRYMGTVPNTQIPEFHAKADVMVFPSLIGGLGLVCFEAMSSALPIITSDGDSILRDGVDALVVPYQDVEGWRRALRRLAANRDYRLALGAAGAERLKAFTWDTYRRGVVRAYEEIAEREAERRAAPKPLDFPGVSI